MTDLKYSKKKQTNRKSIDVQEFKAMNDNEAALQRQCEQLLDVMGLVYYRIPDFLWGSPKVDMTTKKMMSHYFKGLPDLTVMIPLDETYCKAVCFELKTKKGVLTGGQKSFQRKLPLIIIRSFEKFTKEINRFVNS